MRNKNDFRKKAIEVLLRNIRPNIIHDISVWVLQLTDYK